MPILKTRGSETARKRRLRWALAGLAAGGLSLWLGYATSRPAPVAKPAAGRPAIAWVPMPVTAEPDEPQGPAAAPSPPAHARRLLVANYHPRPAKEWQGMAVDLSSMPYCESVRDCPMALACDTEHERCGACGSDADCVAGEVCVLDRCVLRDRAACRVAADCPSEQLCVLSDLGRGGRGNDELRASCQSMNSGTPQPRVEHPAEAFVGPDTPSRRLVSRLVDPASNQPPLPLDESPLPAEPPPGGSEGQPQ